MKKPKTEEIPADQQFALFAPAPAEDAQAKPLAQVKSKPTTVAAVAVPTPTPAAEPARPSRPKRQRSTARQPKTPPKKSGAIPEGDVRMTANIRADLHLKLKITAATRRTTIGELIEGLVEKYLK